MPRNTKTSGTKATTNSNVSKGKGESEMAKKTGTTSKVDAIATNPGDDGKVKLSEMEPIILTLEEFEGKTSGELTDLISDRLSRERSKAELVERIKDGRVRITVPEVLMDWTFKSVTVQGVDGKIRGRKDPKVNLTQDQFDALSDTEKAGLVEKYTNKRRVAENILPELIRKGMPLSPEDTVYLTNERITIEGVVVEKRGNGRQPALTDGVEFA